MKCQRICSQGHLKGAAHAFRLCSQCEPFFDSGLSKSMLPGFMQASASKHKCQYPALFENVKDFCDLKRSESIP
jgi:putative component of membrane protein insertase Oxa1/YidC/SpoIIIJ protein YidD